MKFLSLVLFCVVISLQSKGANLTTENLALRLWNVYDKETNASYVALDSYRLKLEDKSPLKSQLADPAVFKKFQTILRNRFIDRVAREFSRKEIINLTAIYKRPEMTKLRLFTMDFWNENEFGVIFQNEIIDYEKAGLPPLPPK